MGPADSVNLLVPIECITVGREAWEVDVEELPYLPLTSSCAPLIEGIGASILYRREFHVLAELWGGGTLDI